MRSTFGVARVALATAVLTSLVAAGCLTREQDPAATDDLAAELAEAPDWVRTNCNSYWDDGGTSKICGVGSFRGTRNIALARTTAVARGRTAIARTLETSIEAMLEDYEPPNRDGKTQASDGEQEVVTVSRQITDFTLSGSEMQDTWISSYGTLYALVALDLTKFQDSVSQMRSLSDNVRQAVQERAPQAFEGLDR
jgi:hypothetical protein